MDAQAAERRGGPRAARPPHPPLRMEALGWPLRPRGDGFLGLRGTEQSRGYSPRGGPATALLDEVGREQGQKETASKQSCRLVSV